LATEDFLLDKETLMYLFRQVLLCPESFRATLSEIHLVTL